MQEAFRIEREQGDAATIGCFWRKAVDGAETFYVILPPGGVRHHFNPYRKPCWRVTGELPKVTVEPSINMIGVYHGYITSGVITDDCEGRKF
jgi:hypothetical protein